MAPELAYATMERGGVKTDGSGEQVREKAGDLAQEGTLGFNTSKLLEEREGYDLRVSELLEGLVVTSFGIEPVVSIVHWQNKIVTASSKRTSCG